ncbi:MAG: hypothetical protein ACE5GU_01865 [Candidatus Scalinduaceae bacterium]
MGKIENKNDIEYKVSKEVTKQIKEVINTWGKIGSIIVGFIIALIGFFGFKGVGYYVREYVEKTVEKEYENIGREQKIFILNYNLEELKKQVNDLKITKELAIEKINQKIDDVKGTDDDDLMIEYLDYFIYLNFGLPDYQEKIASIVKKYGKDYSLSATSWTNSAISNMDLYELYGAKEYKVASLESCEKALQKLPGYGTAQAVKLLIGIIDYDKVENKEEKEKQQKATLQILKEINSGSLSILSYETFQYLEIVGEAFKKYVDRLFEIFPAQMDEMKQRYMKYKQELGVKERVTPD